MPNAGTNIKTFVWLRFNQAFLFKKKKLKQQDKKIIIPPRFQKKKNPKN
jgi:hypothetical protein